MTSTSCAAVPSVSLSGKKKTMRFTLILIAACLLSSCICETDEVLPSPPLSGKWKRTEYSPGYVLPAEWLPEHALSTIEFKSNGIFEALTTRAVFMMEMYDRYELLTGNRVRLYRFPAVVSDTFEYFQGDTLLMRKLNCPNNCADKYVRLP
jgi:hypothetical protein